LVTKKLVQASLVCTEKTKAPERAKVSNLLIFLFIICLIFGFSFLQK